MKEPNEVTEMWRDHRLAGQKKKASNQEASTQTLIDEGVKFESKNHGVHLIVQGLKSVIDYWPSTGKFIPRGAGRPGRGIRNLLKQC